MGLDMTRGNIPGLILRFFVPFLLANILNSLYNTVDTVIIGQFIGADGITASSTAGRVMQMFTYFSTGLASGGQTVISQLVGARKRDEVNETVGTMFSEMLLISVPIGVVCALLSRNIIALLNTPAASFEDAVQYLFITSCGLPLIFGYNFISSILRGMGDSRKPLLFIAIATGVNVVGDLLLVGVFEMGVAGAAIATVGAQGVSCICSLFILFVQRERFGFDFRLRSFRIKWEKLKLMLIIGLPMAFREILVMSTKLVITGFVNLYDPAEVAAYNICDKFYSLSNVFAFSTRQAAATMIAQNIGANKYDRAKSVVKDTLIMNMIVFVLLAAVSVIMPRAVFSAFTTDEKVLACAPIYMLVSCIMFFFSDLNGPFDSVVTGTGNAFLGFLGGFLDGVVLRVGFGVLFGYVAGLGAIGFFLGDCLARVGCTMVSLPYYASGAWKKRGKLIKD